MASSLPPTKIGKVACYDTNNAHNRQGQSISAVEPDIMVADGKYAPAITSVIPFILQLTGIPNVEAVLDNAQASGISDEDLWILEAADVEMLLPDASPLQQRKFFAVCKYIQDGGQLQHGMTMSTVYKFRKVGPAAAKNSVAPTIQQAAPQNVAPPTTNVSQATPAAATPAITPAKVETTPSKPSNSGGGGGCSSGRSASCGVTSLISGLLGGAGSCMTTAQNQVGQVKTLHSQFGSLLESLKAWE